MVETTDQPNPFREYLTVGALPVIPAWVPGIRGGKGRWEFQGPGGRPAGTVARVGHHAKSIDEPYLQLLGEGLAPSEIAVRGMEILQSWIWLDGLPAETRVDLEENGKMVLKFADRDFFYGRSKNWAKVQRKAGFVPVIVLSRGYFHALAMVWPGPKYLIDLDKLLERVKALPGFVDASEMEIIHD